MLALLLHPQPRSAAAGLAVAACCVHCGRRAWPAPHRYRTTRRGARCGARLVRAARRPPRAAGVRRGGCLSARHGRPFSTCCLPTSTMPTACTPINWRPVFLPAAGRAWRTMVCWSSINGPSEFERQRGAVGQSRRGVRRAGSPPARTGWKYPEFRLQQGPPDRS